MKKRLLIYMLLIFSLFILPWWVTLMLAFGAVFIVPGFYESMVVVFLVLSVFTGSDSLTIFAGVFTAAMLVLAVEYLIKPRLTWYDKIGEIA